jgi:hypothetical protein
MKLALTALFISLSTFFIGYSFGPTFSFKALVEVSEFALENPLRSSIPAAIHDVRPVAEYEHNSRVNTWVNVETFDTKIDIGRLINSPNIVSVVDPWHEASIIDALNQISISELFYLLENKESNSLPASLIVASIFHRDPAAALDYMLMPEVKDTFIHIIDLYITRFAKLSTLDTADWLSRHTNTNFSGVSFMTLHMTVTSVFRQLAIQDELLALSYLTNIPSKFIRYAVKGISSQVSSSEQFRLLTERFAQSEQVIVVQSLQQDWATKFPKELADWYQTEQGMPNKLALIVYKNWAKGNFEDAANWYINRRIVDASFVNQQPTKDSEFKAKMRKVSSIVNTALRRGVERDQIRQWINTQQNDVHEGGYFYLVRSAIYDNTEYAIEQLHEVKGSINRYNLSRDIGERLSEKDKVAGQEFANNSEFAARLQKEAWY